MLLKAVVAPMQWVIILPSVFSFCDLESVRPVKCCLISDVHFLVESLILVSPLARVILHQLTWCNQISKLDDICSVFGYLFSIYVWFLSRRLTWRILEPIIALLVYDYFLTLGFEIERFWIGRFGRFHYGSLLFFANRYLSLLGYIPVALEFFMDPRVSCQYSMR